MLQATESSFFFPLFGEDLISLPRFISCSENISQILCCLVFTLANLGYK